MRFHITLPIFLTFLSVSTGASNNPLLSYEVVYGWKQLDFRFPSNQTRTRLISTGEFIPENNVITGVKVWGNRLYLTVPRWREGVPATLVSVEFDPKVPSQDVTKGPLLNPFPSWEMNQLGNCKAFQFIQSMEIDQFGRMWIVDVGRVNIFGPSVNKCPPKLVLVNLGTNEILRSYEFPQNVVSPTGNFLNDIVIGCETKDDCFAYITDAKEAKIVVYNYQENRSWFVQHESMVTNSSALQIQILGTNYTFNTSVDGLALSPKDAHFDRLYFNPLSSYNLFSVSTKVLKSAVNGISLEDSEVKDHGQKSSQTDGIAINSKGVLFFGLLSSNGVGYFNTSDNRLNGTNEVLLVQNDIDLQWPDTFGFDDKGYLYMTTNRLQKYISKTEKYDFTETNFRVARVYIGSKSYAYSASDKISSEEGDAGISKAAIDANPVTNMDTPYSQAESKGPLAGHEGHDNYNHPNNQYETNDNVKKGSDDENDDEVAPNSDSKKGGKVTNSSIQADVHTGALVLILAAYVFHPAI